MNLHEYQAKLLFGEYGIPLPAGKPAASVAEALAVAEALGGAAWVVKAQVHAGGRGKAGGGKKGRNRTEPEATPQTLIGTRPRTHPPGAGRQPTAQRVLA